MKFSWITFEIAINLFEGWMYCFFLRKKMNIRPERSSKQVFVSTAITIALITVFYSTYIWFDIQMTDTIVWLFPFLYSLYLFSDKWIVKLGWTACAAVLTLCVANIYSSLFMALTGKSWEEILAPSFQRVVIVIHCNITMFILLYSVTKIRKRQPRLSRYTLILFIIINFILVVGLEMLFELSLTSNVPDFPVIIAILCLLGASLGNLVMFELLSYNAEKQSQLEMQLEISRLSASHNEEMRTLYRNLVEYRHNLKNHFSILEHMIAEGNISESQKHLSEIKQISLPIRFATGCTAVDAILSVKAMQMKKEDIHFEFISYPLHVLPISEVDFCTILGNLLDNAIEAIARLSSDCRENMISLKFARTRGMLYIICKNTADPKHVQIKGAEFLSSKRNGKIGIGIPSIRRIVDTAEGYCSFQLVNEEMIVEISLPYHGGQIDG